MLGYVALMKLTLFILYLDPVIDRTLAVFMCLKTKRDEEEEGDHMRVPQGLMVVFDLNQWYHSQMPVFACWSSAEQHRYETLIKESTFLHIN